MNIIVKSYDPSLHLESKNQNYIGIRNVFNKIV